MASPAAAGGRPAHPIACNASPFCEQQLWSLCDNTNPNAWMAEEMMGYTPSGLGGRGPDACIDAVGMESHADTLGGLYDYAKQKARLSFDRPTVLRQAITACRKGGVVSVPGVYGGFLDRIPFGVAMNKGLTFRMGQTHVMRYMKPLPEHVERKQIDPSFVITHRLRLEDAPQGYKTFRDKQEHCIKVVLDPWAGRKAA